MGKRSRGSLAPGEQCTQTRVSRLCLDPLACRPPRSHVSMINRLLFLPARFADAARNLPMRTGMLIFHRAAVTLSSPSVIYFVCFLFGGFFEMLRPDGHGGCTTLSTQRRAGHAPTQAVGNLVCCQRPYRVECTGSLPNSEVKRRRARLVLLFIVNMAVPGRPER